MSICLGAWWVQDPGAAVRRIYWLACAVQQKQPPAPARLRPAACAAVALVVVPAGSHSPPRKPAVAAVLAVLLEL